MNPIKTLLTLAALTAVTTVQATESPTVDLGTQNYTLNIPYFEYQTANGTAAASVVLRAPKNSNPLFAVDFPTLIGQPTGNRPKIKGKNVCLKTAHGSFLSCQSETRLDYAIDTARCLNSNDDECADDLDESFDEEMKECSAINTARIELCGILGGAAYIQELDPDDFIDPATITPANANPYFPLVRGNTWVYASGDEMVTVQVTDRTIDILGITATVVSDIVTEDGESIEVTDDWYAQDKEGNVWYLGEISKNFEGGFLEDLEGSWRSGNEEAQPGILLYAHPEDHIGETYRQEFLAGVAEDFARVISVTETVATDTFSCDGNCLQTYENSAFEPVGFDGNTPETKLYLPGVGIIRSFHFDPATGELADDEEFEDLVSFTPGS